MRVRAASHTSGYIYNNLQMKNQMLSGDVTGNRHTVLGRIKIIFII